MHLQLDEYVLTINQILFYNVTSFYQILVSPKPLKVQGAFQLLHCVFTHMHKIMEHTDDMKQIVWLKLSDFAGTVMILIFI